MFTLYAKNMSDEELIALKNVWANLISTFEATYTQCTSGSLECKDCKYSRLCSSFARTGEYIDRVIKKRNLSNE